MASKTILYKILEKAQQGGFNLPALSESATSFSVSEFKKATGQFTLKISKGTEETYYHSDINSLFNNEEFAKAFFGEMWSSHQNLMAISGDPLDYLAESISREALSFKV